MLKISLAGANNSVPTTGLTPCIVIVHVYVIIVAPKKTSTPPGIPWRREWRHSANSTLLYDNDVVEISLLHVCTGENSI